MSTFLFPRKTCLKLDAIIQRFWWKAETIENGDQFLALRSWKSICLLKNKGGLGLRNFSDFNKALVSKLAWQIFQKLEKLWCQVIIAKYLRTGTELFSSVQVQEASWIWHDVVKCAKIIQLGACMPVSTHSNIRIWEDPWIPTIEDAQHIFLRCPFSEKLWMLSKWQVRLHPLSHLRLREWFLIISDPKSTFFPPDCNQQEFITAWALTLELTWKERNDRLHGKEAQPLEVIAQLIHKSTTKYADARVSRKICSFDNCAWSPPPPGWIKINTDIALKDNQCVTAIVAQSHQCRLILAETKEVWFSDANLAELRAIRIAALRAICSDFENVIFLVGLGKCNPMDQRKS
ncbi:UNVERIFIED_CONTAM: hypothetical protein Sradi_4566000 [Sesamum radiatum]|uniref:Reverse transcriptase zinc-binding domain-containing protein n=1 Tax=Sesamum radiatum TaxID=300843 RepID=A0AAW2NAF7_SESRA